MASLRVSAALLGATGVGLGAYGAHSARFESTKSTENWKTAVTYQLVHAVAVLSVSAISESTTVYQQKSLLEAAGKCLAVGSAMFSGSIYMLILEIGPKALCGLASPLGGLLMMIGWGILGLSGVRKLE